MHVKVIVQKAHAGFANTMGIAFQRHANICTITCSSFYDYLLKVQSKRLIFGWIKYDFTRCHLGPLVLFILSLVEGFSEIENLEQRRLSWSGDLPASLESRDCSQH